MAGKSTSSGGETGFPIRAIVLGVAAMVLIGVGSIGTAWFVGNRIRNIASAQVEVLSAAAQLQRQRELLELYATIAIATGDETYAFRYGQVQPELRQTLGELREAIDVPENQAAILGVEQAERAITAMEFHALDLAVGGQREAAQAVFERRRYRQFADAYRSGLAEIQQRTRTYVAEARRDTNRFLTLNLLASMAALVLIALAWLLLLRPARAWGRQLQDARRRAERAAAAKGEFLAVMSHEMRTPLNSIIGFADLALGRRELKGEVRRYVELVQASGEMLLTVINDLLDFSKIEAGRIELTEEPFALETLVDNAVSIIRHGAEAKGLALEVERDSRLSPFYRGDENRLRQVLLNLLNNAVKFTAAGKVTLTIAGWRAKGGRHRLRFTVSDTGPGIARERQGRLFEPFVQADASITRSYGGTGLGLSISKRLVEAMGGAIGLESEGGKGASFWFDVPLAPSEAPEPRIVEDAPVVTRPASILLVEDLAINRELALAMLARGGHRVDVAEDGEQAVEAARQKAYDLILMDVQMPRMDGLTATRTIRRFPGRAGKVPIVAMTANVLAQQVAEFRKAGMDAHVPKPITQAELDRAIASALAAAPAETPAPRSEEAAFEESTFALLASTLDPDRLRAHAEEMRSEAAAVASEGGEADPDDLARRAHRLVSGTGWLGLRRLSARALDLEQAAKEGTDVPSALAAFRAAAGDIETHVLPRLQPAHAEAGEP
jgi:signal transduction histidine kinase/DNA-binding response OmpR family regulator